MYYKLEPDSWLSESPVLTTRPLREKMAKCRILGLGAHVPQNFLTNEDLAASYGVTPDWIYSRTGIHKRAILEPGRNTSDMGALAAAQAIKDSGIDPGEITHLLLGSCAPDGLVPNTACNVARKLGLSRLVAFDFNVACSGFLYGMYMAGAILCLEPQSKVLLVTAEAMSRICSPNNLGVRILFGDGAGAAVLARGEGAGIKTEDVWVTSDGGPGELLMADGGGSRAEAKPGQPIPEDYFLRMQGKEVFRHAVRDMAEAARVMLDRNGIGMDDIDLFVPHQANGRIISAVADQLGFPMEKVFSNLHETGNTSGASIPIALAEAQSQGLLRPGSRILLTAFGAGFTWGSALLRCE
jgi:3-oxoacyl-[acyl-carrier-protein] synthase III